LTSAVDTHGTASFKMSDKVSFGGVEEFDEEEVESTGGTSYQSVSEYEGNVADIPKTMFFGPELCRARFHMKSTGSLVHICGNLAESCRQTNHRILRDGDVRGDDGFYDTIRSGKTIDGKSGTYCSKEEMENRASQRRADNIASLETMLGMDGIHLGESSGDTAEWLDAADGAYDGLTDRRGTGQLPAMDDDGLYPEEETLGNEESLGGGGQSTAQRLHLDREAVRAQMAFLVDQLRALDVSMEAQQSPRLTRTPAPPPAPPLAPAGRARAQPVPRQSTGP
jgi:hypothetical protein